MNPILLGAVFVVFIAYLLYHDGAPVGIPRIGKKGVIGYIQTALQYTVDAARFIQEGNQKFGGRPFTIPTLAGWIIVLSSDHVETLRASNDTIFNQPISVNEGLQLDHTMNPQQQGNPYQAVVTRNDITKAIASFIPEVLDETSLAMDETFRPPPGADSVSLPLFHILTHMIGRISNRAMLGKELCRNDHFIHSVVNFAETLVLYAQILNWMPRMLRPIVYFVLSTLFGGQKQPKKYVTPYIKRRLRERQLSDVKPHNIAEFLIDAAPPEEGAEELAMRVLNLNFGSIHTSSIFLSQALFELAVLPRKDKESIRDEVIDVLEQEGGWNKAALNKFRKLDSVLREVGRVYGLGLLGMGRRTIKDGQLPDGTVIPAGYAVAVNLRSVHFSPETYPNPEVFDPFRFSKLRDDEDTSVKYGFTTVESTYLPFGAGRHACPGRFFASMELKIMMAYLLLNYEVSLPDGQIERPKSINFNTAVVPNGKAHLMFRPRADRKRI